MATEGRDDGLVRRIDRQGWGQGCLVDINDWVFIANAGAPTSLLGAQVARQFGIRSGRFVAHAEPEEQVGVIVTSQTCDLVADPIVEPFCEGMPLVRIPADQALPRPNSTRAFLVNAEQRLVADCSYRLEFEKSLLPDTEAAQLLDGTGQRLFAAWVARRASRVAFPNDFAACVGRSIEWVWRKRRFSDDPVARHLYLWRVGFYGTDDEHVDFLVPFDEREIEESAADVFVAEFFDAVRRRLPVETTNARGREGEAGGEAIRDYTIGNARARPANRVSMRQMLDMPPLNLEYLTYGGNAISGAESYTEREG